MTNTRKKVILRRFSPGLLRGYLPQTGFVRQTSEGPAIELLDLEGKVQVVPLHEVRLIFFVREFNSNDEANPERLPRRTFMARPRSEGLWVRLILLDDEQIEGLAPLDLSLAESLGEDLGLQFTPPDVRGNTQRMYVPRSAMASLQVVAVVTTPTRRKRLESLPAAAKDEAQLPLALPQPTQ